MTESFDVLIVGGGSAGAVLANRLSADSTRRVLLLEAGSAYSPNLYPADLANADIVGGPDGHDWGYVGAMGTGGRSLNAPRGKVLGGSSAINAGDAIRARAADLAKWSAIGIRGWSYAEVLASYKAIENSPDGDDQYRGRSGPLPIRTRRRDRVEIRRRIRARKWRSQVLRSRCAAVSPRSATSFPLVEHRPPPQITSAQAPQGRAYLDFTTS